MNETISRQAALDIAPKLIVTLDGYEMHNQAVANYCVEITQLPPAEPERIKSKWALHTYMPHNKFCLACRNDSPYNKRWAFCPNCGADMREVTT